MTLHAVMICNIASITLKEVLSESNKKFECMKREKKEIIKLMDKTCAELLYCMHQFL